MNTYARRGETCPPPQPSALPSGTLALPPQGRLAGGSPETQLDKRETEAQREKEVH